MRSERQWIRRIREMARRFAPEIIMGIGDDAAILKRSPGKWWLVTTDALIEGVHFRREYTPARLLGHKALVVNLSDIAAMGGRPRFFVLSLAVPEDLDDAYVEGFLEGIVEAADRYAVVLIGGNLAASPHGLSAHVTVIGECAAHRAVRRDGAMPGEAIYVTGRLGLSALGLRLLEAGYRLSDELPEHLRRPILAHLAPEPRLSLAQYLAEEGVARAMIDLSDGLSSDLRRLCEESRVGAVLQAEALPVVAEASALGADPLALALHGGEDYELLFTVREEHTPCLETVRMRFPDLPLTCIGRTISDPGQVYLERAGHREPLAPRGYDHFSLRSD